MASSRGNLVSLLRGARPTYDALAAGIDAAEHRAWLSIYAFVADASGRPILSALERAAARGVDVRLVVDAFGSRGLSGALARLVDLGGIARVYPALRPGGRWRRPDARNHKKVSVLDSRVAFVGGVNVGDQFLEWRDLHLRVEGPAAYDLEDVVLADLADAVAVHGQARRGASPSHGGASPRVRSRARNAVTTGSAAVARPVPGVAGAGRLDVVTSRQAGALHAVVRELIAGARHSVRVTTPYFVPDPALVEALTGAARRGADVEILTPRRSNWPMANWAGRRLYPTLLAAGVRVAEHHGAMLHAKAIVVDGRVAAIGSPNFDARSFHINGEVLCLVHERSVVAEIEQSIADDRADARAVGLAELAERSRWDRVVERGAAVFSRWL